MFARFLWTDRQYHSIFMLGLGGCSLPLSCKYSVQNLLGHPYLKNTTMFSDKCVHAWMTQTEGERKKDCWDSEELQGLVTLRKEGHWDSGHKRHQVSALAMHCYLTHAHPTMFCIHLLVLITYLYRFHWHLYGLSMNQARGPTCYRILHVLASM